MNKTLFIQQLKEHHLSFKENELLSIYTSLKIGGKADFVVFPHCHEEIQLLLQIALACEVPVNLLGNGSNTLVLDEGVTGLVIILKDNYATITHNNNLITAQAGALIKEVCLHAYQQSLGGMEFAYGIPASVGGALVMNAGAYGGEMKDIVSSCTFLDENNNLVTLHNSQLEFDYRHSIFSDHNFIVLEATFQLDPKEPELIKILMDRNMASRIEKQPLEYPSAGSTFKRPAGSYASKLIEQSGLKGYRYKGVMVSDKHAGFVINIDHASSDDMLELIEHIKKTVKADSGYELVCEMKIVK